MSHTMSCGAMLAQHLEFLPGDILCDTVQPFFVISLAMNFTSLKELAKCLETVRMLVFLSFEGFVKHMHITISTWRV